MKTKTKIMLILGATAFIILCLIYYPVVTVISLIIGAIGLIYWFDHDHIHRLYNESKMTSQNNVIQVAPTMQQQQQQSQQNHIFIHGASEDQYQETEPNYQIPPPIWHRFRREPRQPRTRPIIISGEFDSPGPDFGTRDTRQDLISIGQHTTSKNKFGRNRDSFF